MRGDRRAGNKQNMICVTIGNESVTGHPSSFIFRIRYWLLAMRSNKAVAPSFRRWYAFWVNCPEYKIANDIFLTTNRWSQLIGDLQQLWGRFRWLPSS
jgi:hypothetical protein